MSGRTLSGVRLQQYQTAASERGRYASIASASALFTVLMVLVIIALFVLNFDSVPPQRMVTIRGSLIILTIFPLVYAIRSNARARSARRKMSDLAAD